MQTTEQAMRRPFHETIVDMIRKVNSERELLLLADLIKETKIPKGHDEIISAWETRWMTWFNSDLGVPAELLAQKLEAEKEEEEKKKAKEQGIAGIF